MYPPATEPQFKHENQQIEQKCCLYPCDHFDSETSHKIAQSFLPGLASACIDNTTGSFFSTPQSVAVSLQKEMVEYLKQRSESFVAESVVADSDVPAHPYDVISEFVDDFVSLKRNFLSGVSLWMLSEQREERIDDLMEEFETSRFWLIETREELALSLIKNVDYKHEFHCGMKFNSEAERSVHIEECSFRTINCTNEGCYSTITAAQLEKHDSLCPFKLVACEQKCLASVTRRDMDRHCVTVCPMKLVNCPFYQVNCRSTLPRCEIEQHNFENLNSHMFNVVRVIHKEVSVEDIKERVKQIEYLSTLEQLVKARDARSLMLLIKGFEAKLSPLEPISKAKLGAPVELLVEKEECRDSYANKEESTELPRKKEKCVDSPAKTKEFFDSQGNA